MATDSTHPTLQRDGDPGTDRLRYRNCLIKPMGTDRDEPLVRFEHVLDATIVAAIVFFAVIAGDVLVALATGQGAYLAVPGILRRLPTAAIAFGMTFFAQFARARGIDLLVVVRRLIGEQ